MTPLPTALKVKRNLLSNLQNHRKESNKKQEEILKKIGIKIRKERKRLGLSLESLAKKVGISKMTLQRIEMGMTSPSIITLTEISFHLKKPIESLIKEGDPKVFFLKKSQQQHLMDPESGIKVLAPRGLITDRLIITSAELRKGYKIETHVNNGYEWALLIKGKAIVTVADTEYLMEEGDCIFYDAHFPHSINVIERLQYVGVFLKDG